MTVVFKSKFSEIDSEVDKCFMYSIENVVDETKNCNFMSCIQCVFMVQWAFLLYSFKFSLYYCKIYCTVYFFILYCI